MNNWIEFKSEYDQQYYTNVSGSALYNIIIVVLNKMYEPTNLKDMSNQETSLSKQLYSAL